MLLVPKQISGFSGVNWGSRALVSLPTGPTYNEIQLVTSLTAAQIRQVSVVLNGDTIIQVSGAQLLMMEKYKGHFTQQAVHDGSGNLTQSGIFVIPFTNPNAKNQAGAYFGGLVTLQGENITLEVEIENGTGALSLEAIAYQAPAQSQRIFEPRIKTHTFTVNSEGWRDFNDMPTGSDISIRRMYFQGALNRLIVERDSIKLFDSTAVAQKFQQKRLKRVPQDGYFVLDPTAQGFEQADILNTGKKSEFVFRCELTAGVSVPILVESLKQVANLKA